MLSTFYSGENISRDTLLNFYGFRASNWIANGTASNKTNEVSSSNSSNSSSVGDDYYGNSTWINTVHNITGNSTTGVGSDDSGDDVFFKPGGSWWARNGYIYDPTSLTSPDYLICVYFTTALCFVILYHSWRVNGPLFHSVRVLTDFSAVMAIFSGFLLLILMKYDSKMTLDEINVLYNVLYNSVFNGGIQISDNYMFLLRYDSVQRMSAKMKIAMHFYIWFVLLFSWTTLYWLLPLFFDMNSDEMAVVSLYCQWLSSVGAILFNLYFTVQFGNKLLHAKKTVNVTSDESSGSTRKMRIMLFKNIGHCVTSTLGILLYTVLVNEGGIATAIQNLINVVGLHLWFNSKVERHIFPNLFKGPHDGSLGSAPFPRNMRNMNVGRSSRDLASNNRAPSFAGGIAHASSAAAGGPSASRALSMQSAAGPSSSSKQGQWNERFAALFYLFRYFLPTEVLFLRDK
jgi:hypothetical protein